MTKQYDNIADTLEAQCEARGLPVSAKVLAQHERSQGLFIGAADSLSRTLEERNAHREVAGNSLYARYHKRKDS
jgi:hypothetical protein